MTVDRNLTFITKLLTHPPGPCELILILRVICRYLYAFVALVCPFLSVSAQVAGTNEVRTNDIRRVQVHEEIDALQFRISIIDGKNDGRVALTRDSSINALLTEVFGSQTDQLQDEIELDAATDHRIKLKYLTGLKQSLDGYFRNIRNFRMLPEEGVELMQAYTLYYNLDRHGKSLAAEVYNYPYVINNILLGSATVFFENPGLNQAQAKLFRQYAEINPADILPRIEKYLDESFADSLLIIAAHAAPEKFYDYAASSETQIGMKIRTIHEPFVELIVKIASDKSGRLIFPFVHSIVRNRLSIDSIKGFIPDDIRYYKLLIRTQLQYLDDIVAGDYPVLYSEMGRMIKRKAEEIFINEINALHDSPDEVRFRVLQPLLSRELYYILVTGEDVIYTSSYTGVYSRMLNRSPYKTGDSLLASVRFDRFRKFIRMAAGYNRLDMFLSTMSAERASVIMQEFVKGLDNTASLEDAVDVADSYSSIRDTELQSLIRNEIDSSLATQRDRGSRRGEAIYDILRLLFISANDSSNELSAKYRVPPAYQLPRNSLSDSGGLVVQQVFFYGDKDGMDSYANFISMFRGRKDWKMLQNPNWIEIRSTGPQAVAIFANKPLDNSKGDDPDAKAQKLLAEYLAENGLKPGVVIHRGHSYHLRYTLEQLPASARLIVLGSCGSYQNLDAVLKKCPDAQIVSSKEVGSALVNEPILRSINESLRKDAKIDWIRMWERLEKTLAVGAAKERFENYIPPHRNLGALFITAFNNREL